MKNIFFIVFSFFVLSCTNSQVNEVGRIVSPKEFAEEINQEGIELLDVRTKREFDSEHIENAKNIDVLNTEEFTKQIQKLDKNKPIYIYCRTGSRSRGAARILEKNGFKNIIDLKGGFLKWKRESNE